MVATPQDADDVELAGKLVQAARAGPAPRREGHRSRFVGRSRQDRVREQLDLAEGQLAGTLEEPDPQASSDVEAIMGLFDRLRKRGRRGSEKEELLSAAAYGGDAEWVRELIADGADGDWRDESGMPLIHQAVSGGSSEVVHLLIGAGADVDARDKYESTALHAAACKKGAADIVRTLIQGGADVDARDDSDRTPLHAAASEGETAAARLLIDAGADVNAGRSAYPPPLLLAALHAHKGMVGVLVQAGADVNARSEHGESPLDAAVRSGSGAVVQLLLRAGADVEAKDDGGKTALNIALEEGHEGIAALLRTGGESGERPLSGPTAKEQIAEIQTALRQLVKLGGAAARRRGTREAVALGHIEAQIVAVGEGLMGSGGIDLVDSVYRRLEDSADAPTVREVTLAWKSGLVGWSA